MIDVHAARLCTFSLALLACLVVALTAANAAVAYEIPTVQTEDSSDSDTWQAGRSFVELLDRHGRRCEIATGCGDPAFQKIRVTDLLTGKRVNHTFGCPTMPTDWSPQLAGIQNFTTSPNGKSFFAIVRTSYDAKDSTQYNKNTSANSDPVCDQIVQWARTVGGSLIQSGYPGSPPGTKTMAGYAFLARSDDGGATWNLVPPPSSLKMISDTELSGGQEIGSQYTAYPTPSGIAYGSIASGVAIYDVSGNTWSDVQPIASTLGYANPYFSLPPDSHALDRKSKTLALQHWRFTESGQLSVWGHPDAEMSNGKNYAYWLSSDANRIIKRTSFSPPRKRLRLQNFSGSTVSMCAPRKLTARSQGFEDAWVSDSGKLIWGITSPNVSIRCSTRNKNLWPNGRLVTDGIASVLVRSKNGGRTWQTVSSGDLVKSGYSFASVFGSSLVARTKKCKRADGSNGARISRLTGTRWKTYGCI